ncbi:MAG: hypothetical protein MZU97_01920 [Bacillus subtilis]|nr:hypothetical protein [Bacillus subtilis]
MLPEYRGGNPIFHVIVNNEAKTGITIHYMDESFDTGDIIYQKEIKIEADETCGTLFSRLNFISSQILIETIEKLEKNETLPRTPQIKEGNYKKAPNVYQDLGDTVIDWNKDAAYIERFVRALNPYFGALTNFRGYAVKIWAGKYILDKPRKEPVGSVYKVSKDALAIVTGKGLFLPTCMQLGNFVITDIQDFIKE